MKPNIGRGDSGKTNLLGCNLDKTSPLIGLIGKIDELNSFIGFVRSINKETDIDNILREVQNDLFIIGSELAGSRKKEITETHVKKLEEYIVRFEKEISPISHFLFPTGAEVASAIHICRAVCREVEREALIVAKEYDVPKEIISYLNRLSDLLFVLARVENKRNGIREEEWNI